MNAARTASARAAEVRAAASAWKSNGVVDAATLEAIQDEYPDARVRLHPAWRVLVFVLVTVAVVAVYFAALETVTKAFTGTSFVFAAVLAILTEKLHGSRFAGTGADAATAFWAATLAATGAGFLFGHDLHLDDRSTYALVALATFLVFGVASWRWGFWFHAGVAAVALFLLIGRLPWPRLVWVLVAAGLIPILERFRDAAALAPPHRRGLAAALAVSAVALYGALNLYSLDHRFVEAITLHPLYSAAEFLGTQPVSTALPRGLALAATAILPIVFLAWGIRARRRLLLDLGIGMAALSVVTWRYYRPIGPRWAFLGACGAVLLFGSLWLGRRLRTAAGGRWHGWTGAPALSETEAGGGEAAAVLAGAVAPRPVPDSSRQDFTGGGQFGGGGASGEY